MSLRTIFSRRQLLAGSAALGAHALAGSPTASGQSLAIPAGRPLPAREQFVIRGAHVLTMDDALGEFANGDVHVRDGEIIAVGPALNAPGVPVIDGSNSVVLPGLVE